MYGQVYILIVHVGASDFIGDYVNILDVTRFGCKLNMIKHKKCQGIHESCRKRMKESNIV